MLPVRSVHAWLVAGLMFLFPLAHLPPSSTVRARFLQVPVIGNVREEIWSPGIFLMPEFWAVALVALTFLTSGRASAPSPARRRAMALVIVSGALVLLGGGIAMLASPYPAVSTAGWIARGAAVLLAWTVLRMAPSAAVVRLWVYAMLAGVTAVGLLGLVFFYREFGWPALSELPSYRLLDRFELYARATYGHSGNTASVLMLTVPVALAMLLRRQATRGERVFLAVVATVGVLNLAVAFQRWAWIALFAGVVAIVWYWRHSFRSLWVTAALLALVAVSASLVSDALGDYYLDALSSASGSSLATRFEAWRDGLTFIAYNPAGYGFGMVNVIGLDVFSAHNLFIDIALEGGLIALLGSAVWLTVHLVRFLRVVAEPDPGRDLPFALLLSLAVFTVYGLFFNAVWHLGGQMIWLAAWWALPAMAWSLELDRPATAHLEWGRAE
jgi:hypothetical protein